MNRKLPRHPARHEQEETPVVLPHVIITVTEAGALDVTVDNTPFPPPQDTTPWLRSTFGDLLDAVTKDRTIAVRIEVRESDGTTFTDIIRTRRRTTPQPPETAPEDHSGMHTPKGPGPELVEVAAEGFVPGEDVALAVIVSHTGATGTGLARALLDQAHLSSLPDDDGTGTGTGEVVLLGRISGTTQVRRLP